jgi:hypothetical protein
MPRLQDRDQQPLCSLTDVQRCWNAIPAMDHDKTSPVAPRLSSLVAGNDKFAAEHQAMNAPRVKRAALPLQRERARQGRATNLTFEHDTAARWFRMGKLAHQAPQQTTASKRVQGKKKETLSTPSAWLPVSSMSTPSASRRASQHAWLTWHMEAPCSACRWRVYGCR